MELTRIADSIIVRWEKAPSRCITGWMLLADPVLRRYSGHRDILRVLHDRSFERREERSRIVRALLRCYQQGEFREYGELLFVAYRPMLCDFAESMRKYMLGSVREERDQLISSAFFEAAARMPTDREESPTVINLALKTKQLALRELGRRPRMLGRGPALEGLLKSSITPEVALRARDGLRALETLAPMFRDLDAEERGDVDPGLRDSTTMRAELRTRFPHLDEASFNRLYQRSRQRRARAAEKIQKAGGAALSQIRDYLALIDQEDSDAWI